MNTKFELDFAAFLENIANKLNKVLTGMDVKAWLVKHDGLVTDMKTHKDLLKIIYEPNTKVMQISINKRLVDTEGQSIIKLEYAAFEKMHKDMIKETKWSSL